MSYLDAVALLVCIVVFVFVWGIVFVFARIRDWEWPGPQSFFATLAAFWIVLGITYILVTVCTAILIVAGVVE